MALRAEHAIIGAALAVVLGLGVSASATALKRHDVRCNGSGNSATVTGAGNDNGDGGTGDGTGNGNGDFERVGIGDNCAQSTGGGVTKPKAPHLRAAVSIRGRLVIVVVSLVQGAHGRIRVAVAQGQVRLRTRRRGDRRYAVTVPEPGKWSLTISFTGGVGWRRQRITRWVTSA